MKTNLDLYLSALNAAKEILNERSNRAIHDFAVNRSKTEGIHDQDYDYWLSHFNNLRTYMAGLNTQETKASILEKKAAKVLADGQPPTVPAKIATAPLNPGVIVHPAQPLPVPADGQQPAAPPVEAAAQGETSTAETK